MTATVPHIRSQVRDAIVGALTSGVPVAGTVEASRAYPLADTAYPAALVYVTGERVSTGSAGRPGSRMLTRTVLVTIVGASRGDDGEDAAEAVAADVEVRLFADVTLGGIAADLQLTGAEKAITSEGDRLTHSVSATYEVDIVAREGSTTK
ncbi:hypothetical protein CHU95_20025 [Niveispirillum lacus]|uniref:DUF3168 domain-containing protein n=1 Tax=Niveispirillum lacus TaxID=1981099 RepID=A0A255YQH8_9PROT|nr:hypothetical protein [Niveispirillum lacus]OYQ31441.1 hypothetical protein CHU95_20025 [Niveispirillum lacus]